METKSAANFKPDTRSTYESHASMMRVGGQGDGTLFLGASTYGTLRLSLVSGAAVSAMSFSAPEARALAAELLIACDAAESAAQKVAA